MYDAIIIGSGVAGGRAALELVRSGATCLLLEAGGDLSARDLPRTELEYSTRMFWGGGIELTKDARIGMLRGRCLGGTSVLNQALLDRFDDDAWDDWRDRTGIDFFTADSMEAHYADCLDGIEASYVDERHRNRNAAIFTAAFDARGLGWSPLFRGQSDCALDAGTDCIACLGGCARESKQSALVTTLPAARKHGLEVECDCEVGRIRTEPDHVIVHAAQRGREVAFRARTAVLAAGAVGSTSLLLRSGLGDRLPALGSRFACHPQVMTFGIMEDIVDAHSGAFQSVKSDDAGLRARGLKVENVFAPPIGTAMLVPGTGREHRRIMRRYRHMASMEVAIRDDAEGRIRVDRKRRVVLEKPLSSSDRAKMRDGRDLMRDLFTQAGALEVVECADMIGLHLMGGCPIGVDPATSVVGPDFSVHGEPRIVVADSALFPSAPGINPSFTVMALAHRAARSLEAVA